MTVRAICIARVRTLIANVGPKPFQGSGGLMGFIGKSGAMVHMQGHVSLIDDRATFEEHWVPELEYWFKEGIDTPGMIMIHVDADRIHYWDGMEAGEVRP